METKKWSEKFFDRINLKVATMILVFIMIISGIVMAIFKTQGGAVIDMKAAILYGKLETGSIGLSMAFLGVILLMWLIWRSTTNYVVNVKRNGSKVEWNGPESSPARLKETINELLEGPKAIENKNKELG